MADGTISVDIESMRKALKCADGVFGELTQEHKELESYHDEYKTIVAESNSHLDECQKIEDSEAQEE